MPARPVDRLGHERVEPDVLGVRLALVAPRQVDEVPHQDGQLVDLALDLLEQALALGRRQIAGAQHLEIRPQRRDRRAELVRGVGHELALRPRGVLERAGGLLQRVQHGVERVGEARELVVARGIDPAAEILGLGDVLGGLRQPLHRRHCRARHEPAEHHGEGHSA